MKELMTTIHSIQEAFEIKNNQPKRWNQLCEEANMTFDYLPNTDLYLFQRKDMFRNNTDTAMLGNFIKIRSDETVLDIGTNNGALLLYASLFNPVSLTGIELQKEACTLADYNLSLHQLEATIIHSDVKDVTGIKADVIISNPPYFPGPDHRVQETSRQIARHEFYLNLETLIDCISQLISENGRCFIVHRADRITDIIHLFHQKSMEVKQLQFIYDEQKTTARSVIIEAKRHAKPGCIVHNPIVLKR